MIVYITKHIDALTRFAYAIGMKALRALRAEKVLVETGAWGNGNIPSEEFPLSHVKKHRLAKAWHWCVHKLSDDGQRYRLLVAFEPGKQQYWAWLAASFGNDQALIARVEYHHSHDGWHCHWKTGPLADVPRGNVKAPYPKERRRNCLKNPDPVAVGKSDAFKIAYKLFNVTVPTPEVFS